MSTMWDIAVIEKTDEYIDLEVVFAHPDAGPFPDNKIFALLLLTRQAYRKIGDELPPLGKAIDEDSSYQPFDVEPRVDEFIAKTVLYEAKNMPWIEDEAHEKMNKLVLAKGIDEESDDWEDAWDTEWRNYWKNKNNFPIALYRIWPTDSKWTEHLKKHHTYDTASWSNQGPWVEENRKINPE